MSTQTFQGDSSILEVRCSGQTIPSDAKLVSLVLYTLKDNKMVGSVSPMAGDCFTSESFTSCDIDPKDSRHVAVATLVLDLGEGESREYGCEVTLLASGGRSKITWWSMVVRAVGKSYLLIFAENR